MIRVRRLVRRARRRFGRPAETLAWGVKESGLTYLSLAALCDLHDVVKRVQRRSVAGRLIEAGCALGGSAIVMAAAKEAGRPLFVHDVFGTIPPPAAEDGPDVAERYIEIASGNAIGIGGDLYYGYRADLLDTVRTSFVAFGLPPECENVHFVPGMFEDTLHPNGPVAVAHIDGDWYASVRVCLERIAPHVPPGGVMVIDDYDAWSGCRRAVDEWLATHGDGWLVQRRARVHLVRR